MTYSKEVADMTWRGDQPAAFYAGLREFPGNFKADKTSALSTLSSVFYSYGSHLVRIELPRVTGYVKKTWIFIRAASCALAAMVASDLMVLIAGGLGGLTANQCDVRQSVLRRAHRFGGAMEAISEGIRKCENESPRPPTHTRALFYLGMAGIHLHFGEAAIADDFYTRIGFLLSRIEEEGEYDQLSRICRHLAEYYRKVENRRKANQMEEHSEWARKTAEVERAYRKAGSR